VRFDRSRVAGKHERGFCIDAVLRLPTDSPPPDAQLAGVGREVVALREGALWKIHLHTDDSEAARKALGQVGDVLAWSWDDLGAQVSSSPPVAAEDEVHIVTDGAASLSRRAAEALGVTLLDSHVDFGERSLPETRLNPDDVYRAMRRGVRVSTAQTSTHERHMHYERLAAQWKQILYLCVGSVYTGNHAVAAAWRASHALGERLTLVDSGVASGKLAVVVRAVAHAAKAGASLVELGSLARAALARAEEYIFVERLEYLARGGRLSKAGAWLGDALGIAPVVSPYSDGARKVALLRKPADRLSFACKQLVRVFRKGQPKGYVLAQYTDNRRWVENTALPELRRVAPDAEIAVEPLSLTTGVHTGPGTWAVAMLTESGK
jgi:DegV family protein with EDD domain